ncbi:putative UDP-kanosamine synthase oxidoreductase subunit [Abditibacteriota bacterium]|nr:putative UDP-kanosamine synthase oxidoreductase subunit [Abditibacteriota bacterium]
MHSPFSSVRVAVVGAGIGRAHVEGYLAAGAEVATICDLTPDKARTLAQKWNIEPHIESDYATVLCDASIEAISLCTPNSLHAPMAIEAMRAGKHVLCEKPLALNAEDAQSIANCARETGRICMVSHVLRFRDDTLELKRRAAEIGEIYYGRAMARRQNGIPKWGGWFTQQRLSGGGPLIDTGVHILDLAWWLAGCPQPVSASGVAYAKFGPQHMHLGAGGAENLGGTFDVEDLAAGMVRFENGLSIHFEASWAINANGDERFCHLHGTQGALLWEDAPKFVGEDGVVEALTEGAGSAWRREMEHFLTCVQSGQTPDPDANQGVVMMRMLDALYLSARENREVAV